MFGTGHDGPWQVHCKILSQYQTGTCPQTAAAAPQSSPASANPKTHCYCMFSLDEQSPGKKHIFSS